MIKEFFQKKISQFVLKALYTSEVQKEISMIMLRENLKDVNITEDYVKNQVSRLVNDIINESAELYRTMWRSSCSQLESSDSYVSEKLVRSFKIADEQIISNIRGQFKTQYEEKLKKLDEVINTLKYVDTEEYLDAFIARVRNKQLQ